MNPDRPISVKLKKRSNLLELCWSDGSVDQISGQNLRRYCACSVCRAKNQVGIDLLTDDPNVVDLSPMGTAGVQLRFGDGHDRGIYPWAYLRAIAQGNAEDYILD